MSEFKIIAYCYFYWEIIYFIIYLGAINIIMVIFVSMNMVCLSMNLSSVVTASVYNVFNSFLVNLFLYILSTFEGIKFVPFSPLHLLPVCYMYIDLCTFTLHNTTFLNSPMLRLALQVCPFNYQKILIVFSYFVCILYTSILFNWILNNSSDI